MRSILVLVSLLFGMFAPASLAQPASPAPGEFEITDREGDPGVRHMPTTPVAVPLQPQVDLLALRIHSEDPEGLWVELRVKQLDGQAGLTHFNDLRYSLDFELESPPMRYQLSWRPIDSFSNATPDFMATLCARPSGGNCVPQRVSGEADYGRDAVSAFVPKLSLMGRNPAGQTYYRQEMPEVPLRVGDKLVEIRAEATTSFNAISDRVPDAGAGGPYALRHVAANDRIQVRLAAGNGTDADQHDYYDEPQAGAIESVSVDAGGQTSIALDLVNRNGAKRVVNITAAFTDPKAAAAWTVRIAPSVAVPGNESQTLNAVVTTTDKIQHRETVLLKIHARSLGFADEVGALTIRLVASVPPSIERNALYFHSGESPYARGNPFCGLAAEPPYACEDTFWMNTLQEDPRGTSDATAQGARYFSNGWGVRYFFVADAPLARDVVLSPKLPVLIKLKVAASGGDGVATASLFVGDTFVGEASQPFGPSRTEPIEVSFLPMLEALRLPAGETMRLDIRLSSAYTSPTAFATPPRITLKESSMGLPIVEDPNATQEAAAPLGDAFISLSLKGDKEEFVNPGEARAFQMAVLNEGAIEDVVSLVPTTVGDGCRAEIRPGAKYRLQPGDSARFGVLVYAPSGAKEGAQCRVRVNATSSVDPAAVASKEVTVVVTRGVDVPNDADNYTANADSAAKLDEQRPQKNAPGPSVLAVLVAAAGLALRRKRRSQV